MKADATHARIVRQLENMAAIIELSYEPDRTKTNAIGKLYQCIILLGFATIKSGEAPAHVTRDD